MSEQAKALELADTLEQYDYSWVPSWLSLEAAAELRRLHEANAELLEALSYAVDNPEFDSAVFDRMARAARARALGQSKGE